MSDVRDVEDRLRRAVVLRERDERRAGKLPREVEDVAEVRAAERVDALRVVADDGEFAMRRAHAAEDARLEEVGVLVLVDEHVVVHARRSASARSGDASSIIAQKRSRSS